MELVWNEESWLLEVEFGGGGWLEGIGSIWGEGRKGLNLRETRVVGLEGVGILVF